MKILKNNYQAKKSFIVRTGKDISGKEYDHVLNVWNKSEMETMKDYHEFYLKCHVLLLAGVFQKFRNNGLKNYGLCPSHYLSAPDLSWDAMLKIAKIKFELITDPDMYIFFEGARSGIFYISNRYTYTNQHIYLDANNLYG